MNTDAIRARNARKRAKLRARRRLGNNFAKVKFTAYCFKDGNTPPLAESINPCSVRGLSWWKDVYRRYSKIETPIVVWTSHDVSSQLQSVCEVIYGQARKLSETVVRQIDMDFYRDSDFIWYYDSSTVILEAEIKFGERRRSKRWLVTTGEEVVVADVIAAVVSMRDRLVNLAIS